jgi:AcrR family transcriptional regulator
MRMDPKELRVVEAALGLFRKLGFQKVTMSDIAQAVGISRPTLYALFPNKKAIFGKFVSSHFERMEQDTDQRLAAAENLGQRLDVVFDVWVISPVSQAIDTEEGRDVIAHCELYAPDAVTDLYDRLERRIFQAIKTEASGSIKAKDTARILRTAAKGLKSTTTDLADLKRVIKTMISMTTRLFEDGR